MIKKNGKPSIGHDFTKKNFSKMTKIENVVNESCSSNLVFLRENRFQED